MGKSKRSINPADALRKAQRKRELKKNKEIRKTAREAGLAKKDTDKLRIDIGRLEGQERSGTIDKTGQTRLTQLKEELAQIEKAKKEVNKPLSKAQEALAARQQQQQQTHDSRKLVFDPKSGKFVPVKRKESSKKASGKGDDGQDSGSEESSSDDSSMSEDEDDEMGIIGMAVEEGSDHDDEQLKKDQESNEEEGHDNNDDNDDIPMPEEPPVAPVMNSDDEIDIPLPPGPPPPQPFRNQLSTVRPQFGPFVPKTPPPPPPGPPPALRYTTMRPPPPPPPPQHLRYSSMRPPPPPPPRPHFGFPPQQPYMHQPNYYAPPRPATAPPPPPVVSPPQQPIANSETSKTATISAEPQLRDLQKELVGFVPAALRRKQAQAKKTELLPKGARPNEINLAPDVE